MGNNRIILTGLALLLAGQPAFSQDTAKAHDAAAMLADAGRISTLQLDLLLANKIVLETRAKWLTTEQQLLNADIEAWQSSRASLSESLNKRFGCEFDMDARACKPKPEEKPASPSP